MASGSPHIIGIYKEIDSFTSYSLTIPGTIYACFPLIKVEILFNALGE